MMSKKKNLFISHLDSLLKEKSSRTYGCAEFIGDDFVNSTRIEIHLEEEVGNVFIQIVSSEDGELKELRYSCIDSERVNSWLDSVINSSLINALGDKKRKYYRVFLFAYFGAALDGEYWIKNVRIAPVRTESCNEIMIDVERFFSVEFELDAIDELDADARGLVIAERHAARLSLLLNLGAYRPLQEHRWFLADNPLDKSELRTTGFYGHFYARTKMPKKNELHNLGKFDENIFKTFLSVGGTIKFPQQARKVFRALDKCEDRVRTAFDSCCLLYQLSLTSGRYSPTVQLSYMVAAVDALSDCESDELSNFGSFVRYYSQPQGKIDHLIDFMHGSVRSSFFHAGRFAGGEYQYERLSTIRFNDPIKWTREHNFRECKKLLRFSICNWLIFLIDKHCAE
ncbi:hypothetical protein [Shewanella litorisediminis]|uniref:Apea-like HEPN domain-containing protein n=1 Tax=Shewanella litorisediminis TaxID=1173586 RepID=A0ABX7G1K2_9GAMM|nr:hypothetical protein [Shewanella litorisediminis]MCL2919072.1 hypothetical protein [Shewanella litorisediminis]QRH01130.1 hypothetical protein JQC75_14890 [Shewanella litorisediminis]